MKQLFLNILFCSIGLIFQAQQEFHVTTNGKSSGNGTLDNPWDLQTALSQKPEIVNGGDTIWLHEGVYNGRFISRIQSTIVNQYILVAPYNNGKVILNGNVISNYESVLNVRGKQVIFRDFEITWLGKFSRDQKDKDFLSCAGISHTTGENCRFYNLTIYNNPGLGIGSWKSTGGTIIENCLIYHNGFIFKNGKGGGEGIYVQNKSDRIRLIKNNIIFANYYKGIEVWSAGRNADFEYVKNITLQGNIIFNSGIPSGNHYDNVIVATDDRNGINIANNINVLNNVFYHNTDYVNNQVNGDAPSLTIGYVDNTPAENITVKNNIILGRNNSLRLLHIRSMILTDNIVYGGYVFLNANEMDYAQNWNIDNNTYFTKNSNAFRIGGKNFPLSHWQSTFNLDKDSEWKHIKEFDLEPILSITEQVHNSKSFNIALFHKQGQDVQVDFSKYRVSKGSSYRIYDVENRNEIIASGIVDNNMQVNFPMRSIKFEAPLHNNITKKTLSNFGVFIIEFDNDKITSSKELSDFQKILKWLGF
jgi:hypothetical protein